MDAFSTSHSRLSRGCQTCQQGKWLCIFLTYLCDAKCAFCPAPFKQLDTTVSAFGNDLPTLSKHLEEASFEGISFSGGEVLLAYDRLVTWLTYLKQRFPHCYFWAYTNGIAIEESHMAMLAREGLNELRFNIAATNYHSASILSKIKTAARIFEHVAVEIPSIPDDYPTLEPVLHVLDEIKVEYLNLHEYIVVDGDSRVGARTGTFTMNKESVVRYDVDSLANTQRIVSYCGEQKLRVVVNNCTLRQKENQMRQRRLVMGRMLKQQYDKVSEDGILETFLIYPKRLTNVEVLNLLSRNNIGCDYFAHPDSLDSGLAARHPGTIAKLQFVPPMSIHEKRKLHRVQLVN